MKNSQTVKKYAFPEHVAFKEKLEREKEANKHKQIKKIIKKTKLRITLTIKDIYAIEKEHIMKSRI